MLFLKNYDHVEVIEKFCSVLFHVEFLAYMPLGFCSFYVPRNIEFWGYVPSKLEVVCSENKNLKRLKVYINPCGCFE